MMLLLILSILSTSAIAKDYLFEACAIRNGTIVRGHICPKSKIPIPARTCFYKNDYQEQQFFNGCSGPTGGYKGLFYPSCIKHDLCYHNEPASNGYSQKKCDQDFLNNMQQACLSEARNKNKCLKWSNRLYRALRIIGKPAYHCANNYSRY